MAVKRILKEISLFTKDPLANCSIGQPDSNNPYEWEATIMGPSHTPYHGGVFYISIQFPQEYPFKPPRVQFITKVYHPNINSNGNFSLEILNPQEWNPGYTIVKVLLILYSMLEKPNPDDPIVYDIAKQFKFDHSLYEATAIEWTHMYASGNKY